MQLKRILVLIPPAWPQNARLLQGVMAFAKEKGGWTMWHPPETVPSVARIREWKVDGLIVAVATRKEAAIIRRARVPAVNLRSVLPEGILPRVLPDNAAIGRMAARHLLDCRFRQFAYIGRKDAFYAVERRRGFAAQLASAGAKPLVFEMPSTTDDWRTWNDADLRIRRFLASIPRPYAIMAGDDVLARLALDACENLGFAVPDEVGILGVDNNELICEFASPTLTSIQRADFETGYQAAALLDRLVDGAPPEMRDLLLPPSALVRRDSTRVVAVEDPPVRKALDYIRDHPSEAFGAERLIEQAYVSRRWLEQRFKAEMHCTIHEYLMRVRIESAKELIQRGPNRPLLEIAAACGFSSPDRFRLIFKRIEGMTPRAYARNLREGHRTPERTVAAGDAPEQPSRR